MSTKSAVPMEKGEPKRTAPNDRDEGPAVRKEASAPLDALEVLFHFSSTVSLQRDEMAIVTAALEACRHLTGSACAFLAVPEPGQRVRLDRVCAVPADDEARARAQLEQPEYHLLYEAVFRQRVAFCENDFSGGKAGSGCIMGAPVLCGQEVIGALGLANKPGGYTEEDRRLLLLFANQVGVAVQNARMVGQIEKSLALRRRQLDSLGRAAQALSGADSELAALQRVVRLINKAFDARSTWVMLCDEQMESFSTQMFWKSGPVRLFQVREPWARGSLREALDARQPVWIPDVTAEAEFPFPEEAARAGLQGMLAVPLVAQKQPLGILAIFTDDPVITEAPDWNFIRAFASQAAAAIQNARWAVAAQERIRREALVDRITAAARESPDVREMLQTTVTHLGEALQVDRCIALLEEGGGEYEEFIYPLDCPADLSQVFWESCLLVRQMLEGRQVVAVEDAEADPAWISCPERLEPPARSLLAVPICRQNRFLGLFLFHQCDAARRWTDAEIDLAGRVADQVAIAVENIRLFRRAVENEKFLATLVEMTAAFASDGALEKILRLLSRQGMRLLGADGAYVWQLDEAEQELVGTVAVGHKAEAFPGLRLPLSQSRSIGAQAIRQKRTLVAHDVANTPYGKSRLSRLFDCNAVVAVPLIRRDKVLGAVVFSITEPGRFFDPVAIERVEILLASGTTAVENARLAEEMRQRAEELEVLWSISQAVTENLEPTAVLERIAHGARELLAADAASVMLYDERRSSVTVNAVAGLPQEARGAVLWMDRHPQPSCLGLDGTPRATTALQEEPFARELPGLRGFRSMLSVPLFRDEETAGALNVFSRRKRDFSIRETKALSTLASFAQEALRNARAFQREQQIARSFQATLLPQRSVRLEGVEIAQRYLAALSEADVGGDLSDVIPLPDGRVGLMIGDIAGKGLKAAVQSAAVKNRLQAFALEALDPAEVLSRLNYSLAQSADVHEGPEWFVTLFYGVLDTKRGELIYANAGHEHPLLLRSGQGEPVLLDTTGPILGLQPAASYLVGRVTVRPGDTLVLYTDGFTEVRREDEFLLVDGLVRFVQERRGGGPEEIVAHVCNAVQQYAGGDMRDDATLMVVRASG